MRCRRMSDSVLIADGDSRKSDFFGVLNPQIDADRSRQVVTDAVLDLERGERSPGKQQQDPDGPSERRCCRIDDVAKSDDRRLVAESLRSPQPH